MKKIFITTIIALTSIFTTNTYADNNNNTTTIDDTLIILNDYAKRSDNTYITSFNFGENEIFNANCKAEYNGKIYLFGDSKNFTFDTIYLNEDCTELHVTVGKRNFVYQVKGNNIQDKIDGLIALTIVK